MNIQEFFADAALYWLKRESFNPFSRFLADSISCKYNGQKFREYENMINHERFCISNINNRILGRGGFATQYEQRELDRHNALLNEYEFKRNRYLSLGCDDAKDASCQCGNDWNYYSFR